MQIMTVKDVLATLAVSRAQLYYWEEVGKIPPARRTSTGKRYYLPEDIAAIRQKLAGRARRV
jgi:DNA-binding transcriptional MerR regulator